MKIKNVEIGGYIQSKKDSKQLIAGHCYQVAEKDVSDKTVRLFSVDDSFDVSLWFCVSDFRKPRPQPKPQLKQLDQSVFDGLDERWVAASVEENGIVRLYLSNENNPYDCEYHLAGTKYDTTDWQNSLIERDTAKEPAEVDLSSELTGSDLVRAMLGRGDKYVMCRVNDDNNIQVISGWTYYGFISATNKYCLFKTPIPINNQGEPLTAAEAGF